MILSNALIVVIRVDGMLTLNVDEPEDDLRVDLDELDIEWVSRLVS